MPNCILRGVIEGDLPRQYHDRNPEVLSVSSLYKQQQPMNDIPCIYNLFLVNARGLAPTATECQQIVNSIMEYVDYTTTD
jgi:hypothetical protein